MDRDADKYKIFSRRAFILGAAKLGVLGLLGGRLAYLQVTEGTKYKTLSEKNRINVNLLAPSRGKIFDRFGRTLADNRQNFRVNIVAEHANDVEDTLRRLSEIVELQENEINKILDEVSKVRSFIPVTIKEKLTWDEVSQIEVSLPKLPGLMIEEGEIRHYPYGASSAHLIGYVGLVNQSELKTGDPVLTVPGFRIGKTGIEKSFDEELRGKAGDVKVEINALGRIIRELERNYGESGRDITLTIDSDFQLFTQNLLKREKSASAVVMDAKDGSIYSLVSSPGFDPNLFSTRISAKQWEELLSDPAIPLTNKALAGQYPPGSTFKMMTILAALEAGVIDEKTTFHCSGYKEIADHRFHCWKRGGHGTMNMVSALAESCDVFLYEIARDVGIDRIAEMSRRFGLGQELMDDIAGVKPGLIPTQEWKQANYGKSWRSGETILASIGQGYLQTTPLQLATMTARLVNGGMAIEPSVVLNIKGKNYKKGPRKIWPEVNIDPAMLKLVKQGMDAVVNSPKGTAKAHAIDEPEYRFGGKTGTAQVRRISRRERLRGTDESKVRWRLRHHALFVGYAPLDNPRYVCAVVVEHGESGSKAAAPLAKELLLEAQRSKIAEKKTKV